MYVKPPRKISTPAMRIMHSMFDSISVSKSADCVVSSQQPKLSITKKKEMHRVIVEKNLNQVILLL